MSQVEVLKKSSVEQAKNAFEAATTKASNLADELEINYNQVVDALNEAMTQSDVDPNYISYDVGQLPSSSGASAGTIGAYFTSDGILQKIEWSGSSWQEIGEAIAGRKYVDDKASLSTDFTESVEITVGSGGDHSTLYQALNSIREKRFFPEVKVTIKVLEGYTENNQIDLYHPQGDQIFIEGDGMSPEDTVLSFDATGWPMSEKGEFTVESGINSGQARPFLYLKRGSFGGINNIKIENENNSNNTIGIALAESAVLNSYNAWIENKGSDDCHGITLIDGSRLTSRNGNVSGCGNRDELSPPSSEGNERGNGILNNGSHIQTYNLKANSCGDNGVRCEAGATFSCPETEATDCGHHGFLATQGSIGNCSGSDFSGALDDCLVAFSGSYIDARNCKANNAVINEGVIATRGSRINFDGGEANNNNSRGIRASFSSQISAAGATTNNNGSDGIRCELGSTVSFSGGESVGNGNAGARVTEGSILDASGANLSNNTLDGLAAQRSAVANVSDASINDNGREGILSETSSQVSARDAEIKNNGRHGVFAVSSSTVSVRGADLENNADSEVAVTRLGIVDAQSANLNSGRVFFNGGIIDVTNSNHGDLEDNANQPVPKNSITKKGWCIDESVDQSIETRLQSTEEQQGTWTPEYVTTGDDFTTIDYNQFRWGRYLKRGNEVMIYGRLQVDSDSITGGSGSVRIGGLPFPAKPAPSGAFDGVATIGYADNWSKKPRTAVVQGNEISLRTDGDSNPDGTGTTVSVDDMDPSENNIVVFSASYIIAP